MDRFSPFPEGMPEGVRALPRDARGIPIPWFVDCSGGRPDFRVVDGRKLIEGWDRDLCWICGRQMFAFRAWIVGPVSAINRCTAEPPAHPDCARVALTQCPFLSDPERARDATPQTGVRPGGELMMRNSGLTSAWITKGRGGEMVTPGNGMLFRLFEPHAVEWYHRGAVASAEAVRAGFDDAAGRLREADRRHGPAALDNLERRITACEKWLV